MTTSVMKTFGTHTFSVTGFPSTTHFRFWVDVNFGDDASNIAQDLSAVAEAEYGQLSAWFAAGSGPISQPVDVGVMYVEGSNGGNNDSSTFICLMIPSRLTDLLRFLFVAELEEFFAAASTSSPKPWEPANSKGEGLSRALAGARYPNALFTTVSGGSTYNRSSARYWLQEADPRPDWINKTDGTDINNISSGCAVLFLNYLNAQLGFSWNQIIAAGGSTLADTYKTLVGHDDAYYKFTTLVSTHYPSGKGSDLHSDSIFPLSSWRGNDLTSATGSLLASSSPFGFVLDSDPNGDSLHAVYLGNDLHIHELYFIAREGVWHDGNLTSATGGPLASSGPTGYIWKQDPNSSSMHIIYLGNDLCIHELWFTVQERVWHDNNLTRNTGAPLANTGAYGYVWNNDPNSSSMHVVYRGNDLCIHELWHTAREGVWHDNNLTRNTGGPLADSGAYGYVWDNDPNSSSMHVVYQGNDLCIHELWHTAREGVWHDNNLTRNTGAPLANTGACGYVWDNDPNSSSMHVVYQGNDLCIHELWHTAREGVWHDNNLTRNTGAPLANTGAYGYVWDDDPNSSSMHVVYQGNDLGIHELWHTAREGVWHDDNLTRNTGSLLANTGAAGYVWRQNSQRVVYQGNDLHIHELWDPAWG